MSAKKTFDYALFALIYFILFFLAATLSSQMILKGEFVKMPNLIGENLDKAKADLAKKRLSLSVQAYQFDSHWEKGKIIFQDLLAGSRLKPNKVVKVIVSEGSEKVTVPKMEGKSLETAASILRNAGLRKGRASYIHTSQFAAGRIISQHPLFSEVVDRDSPIHFLVSQGAVEGKYLMPDLIERNADSTIQKLREMEFKIADIHYAYYPGLGPGIIIKQSPLPGYRIQKRNLISLEVSK
ncbi:MAG: PASTA domain-containing protein [Candidatus Aminicenantales bacterium]